MQGGLIIAKSNADLMAEEQAQADEQRRAEQQYEQSVKTSLAGHIQRRWEVMRRHKEPIEQRMLDNLRQISGRYSEQKEQEIREQGLPPIFMQLTAVKCRAAKSWIRDVLMPSGDRPWQLSPTADPSMNPQEEQQLAQRVQQDAIQFWQATGQQITPDLMQQKYEEVRDKINDQRQKEADRKASRMADVIQDQLVDGGWNNEFDQIISDVVDYPAAIMKGPVMRYRQKLQYVQDPATGGASLRPHETIVPDSEWVDPFSFYVSPGAATPDEGDTIEVHEYTLDQIHDLIGLPGYDEDALRRVLRYASPGGMNHWTRESLRTSKERARGQFSGTQEDEQYIEALEYWGSVQGQQLLDWGLDEQDIPDAEAMHDIMAVLIAKEVVCVRFNPDPLGRKPYVKACFENVPGAFWGKGVPDLIKDCQDVCNASARALVANMGISSGPQVGVNSASLAPGQDVETMYPWKIWPLDYSKTGASSRPPIDFFQPNSITQELMAVYKEFAELADEYSGIPSYTYGMDSARGAGGTASGLSMLMNAASKAIKNVIKHIDTGIIEPLVHRYYVHNMLWNDDESIKGDAQVVARGAMSLVAKEQNQMRLQELLQQTANPMDMQILGMDGRATMLRHALQGVDVGGDTLVPSEDELQRRLQMQAMQGQPEGDPQQQGEQPREAAPDGQPAGQRMG